MIRLTLPWPPSVNRYWRAVSGRVLISRNGRAYRTLVGQIVACSDARRLGSARLAVVIVACPPDRRRRDLDNTLKATLDALSHAGLFDDDEQIDDLRITRGPAQKPGCLEITLTPLESAA